MPRHRHTSPADDGLRERTNAWCARCEQAGKACPSCRQRKARARKLVRERGLTTMEAARLMRLPKARVELFVVLEDDRHETESLRCNSIPTERLRAFIEAQRAKDPELTYAELAHRLGMAEIDLLCQFGYLKPKKSNGATGKTVGIELASRTVIKLGRAPHELEGC